MKNTCPNCGAETIKPICEYCGSVVSPKPKRTDRRGKDTDLAMYILPWPKKYQSDDEIIAKSLIDLLDIREVPTDMFNHITDIKVTRYFIPVRQFNGNVITNWNCIQVFDRQRIVGYENKNGYKEAIYEYYEEYVPANGTGADDFNFIVPVATHKGLPQTLINCLEPVSVNPRITDNAILLSHEIVEDALIVEEDAKTTEKEIDSEAREKIGYYAELASFHNLSGWLKDQNFTYSWNWGNAVNKRLLIPAAAVQYKYKGKEYASAYIFNSIAKKEYPQETNNLINDIEKKSNKSKVSRWFIISLSIILSALTMFLWGDFNPADISIIVYITSVIITSIICWILYVIQKKYDKLAEYSEDMSSIRRIECFRKAFPKFKNHSLLNLNSSTEAETRAKIRKTNSTISGKRLFITLLIVVQIIIAICGWGNMNAIPDRDRNYIESVLSGRSYSGSALMTLNGEEIKISFLDNYSLSYQTYDYKKGWSIPKTTKYNLSVNKRGGLIQEANYDLYISFDNYYGGGWLSRGTIYGFRLDNGTTQYRLETK